MQLRDTSHGRVGDGPNLSPSKNRDLGLPQSQRGSFSRSRSPATTKRDFLASAGPSPTRSCHACGQDPALILLRRRSAHQKPFRQFVMSRPPRVEPAEGRGFWGVTADGDSQLSLVTPAGPVERFGTASVVTLACYCREMRCRLKNHPGTPSDLPVCKSQSMALGCASDQSFRLSQEFRFFSSRWAMRAVRRAFVRSRPYRWACP